MSASVLPFPAVRRSGFAQRHACRMAELSPDAAERHLQRQLRIQAETMARKGIAMPLIEAELNQLESAIRAALLSAIVGGAR